MTNPLKKVNWKKVSDVATTVAVCASAAAAVVLVGMLIADRCRDNDASIAEGIDDYIVLIDNDDIVDLDDEVA